jgi:TM2 domain-containing membrane protein YozV
MKNRTTAGIFALILGGLGVHKFYLGKTGQGIIYLLFCWTFIPAIIALIEGIKFLTMSDEQFAGQYNSGIMQGTPNPVNVADEIEKLHKLKESGAITEAEYNAKKSKLLG